MVKVNGFCELQARGWQELGYLTLEDTAVRLLRSKLKNIKLAVDSSVREMEALMRQFIMLLPSTAHYNAAAYTPQRHAA